MQTRGSANILGLDISEFQTITDKAKLFSDYPDYIYLRAFGSAGNPDTKFGERVQLAKLYNVPSGAYYFAHPSKALGNGGEAEVDTQMNQFADLLEQAYGAGKYGDLIPFLDVEAWGTTTPQHPMLEGITGLQLVEWVKRFRDQFFARTGRRLGFYSNRYFMTDPTQMGLTNAQFDALKNMPLWLAEYDKYYPGNVPDTGAPANFGGWTTYCLWQYAVIADADQHGLSHGTNEVDHDRTDSVDRLKPPPPPTNVFAVQSGDNTIDVNFTKPPITDYLGASIYVNGTWKKWVSGDVTKATIDITAYPRNVDLSYQVIVEDAFSDFGKSSVKNIRVYETKSEADVKFMPTAAMGTTIRKTAGTAIAGLTSIGGLDLSSDTIDTTTLDTTGNGGFRTFQSSFKDAGEVSLSGFFEYTSHSAILADFMDNGVDEYVITFPGGITWTFDGVVTGFSTGADLEDLISFEATIKVSGAPTLAGGGV